MTPDHTPEVIRDLYNARQVMHTAGWATEDWLNMQGRVCLDGALEIATGVMKVVTGAETIPYSDEQIFMRSSLSGSNDETTPRHLRAQEAVAARIHPVAGCHMCDHIHKYGGPADKVTHYNDAHCDGAEDADDILRETAEKLEADLP